jgi:hypothetical protein
MHTASLPSRLRLVRSAAITALAIAAVASFTAPAQAAKLAVTDTGDGGAYCTSTGGVATTMRAWAGTNNDAHLWTPYGGIVQACTYTAADTSQIVIWQNTLRSPVATMAALAYYAEVPYNGGGPGNPSTYYCEQVKGSWQVGNGLDGGGWANGRGQEVYGMCVFADGSAIDAWGLLYHSAGTIRGIDLGTVLKFPNPY